VTEGIEHGHKSDTSKTFPEKVVLSETLQPEKRITNDLLETRADHQSTFEPISDLPLQTQYQSYVSGAHHIINPHRNREQEKGKVFPPVLSVLPEAF